MEIRRGTLRTVLHDHLKDDRVAFVMETLEPFFCMTADNRPSISTKPLEGLPKPIKGVAKQKREELFFALHHSFLSNFLSLLRIGSSTAPSDLEKRLSSLLFEWILAECSPEHETERNHLHSLVLQTANTTSAQ